MTIREEVSRAIGLFIGPDGWDDAFTAADQQGKLRVDPKVRAILLSLCKRMEKLENEQPADK